MWNVCKKLHFEGNFNYFFFFKYLINLIDVSIFQKLFLLSLVMMSVFVVNAQQPDPEQVRLARQFGHGGEFHQNIKFEFHFL